MCGEVESDPDLRCLAGQQRGNRLSRGRGGNLVIVDQSNVDKLGGLLEDMVQGSTLLFNAPRLLVNETIVLKRPVRVTGLPETAPRTVVNCAPGITPFSIR